MNAPPWRVGLQVEMSMPTCTGASSRLVAKVIYLPFATPELLLSRHVYMHENRSLETLCTLSTWLATHSHVTSLSLLELTCTLDFAREQIACENGKFDLFRTSHANVNFCPGPTPVGKELISRGGYFSRDLCPHLQEVSGDIWIQIFSPGTCPGYFYRSICRHHDYMIMTGLAHHTVQAPSLRS